MAQEDAGTGRKKKSAFWKAATSKTGKIVGVLTVAGTLVTAVAQITGGARELAKIWRPDRGCFKAEMGVLPAIIPVGKWNTVKFRLIGPNDCRETLDVHVAYKVQSDAVRIEPPFKAPEQATCSGYDNPDCWEAKTLDSGKEIDWTLIPPRLTPLSPLSDPVKIEINWIVYNTETRKQVRAGKTEVTVKGEREV